MSIMPILEKPKTESLVWRLRGLFGVLGLILIVVTIYSLWDYVPEVSSPFTVETETGRIHVVTITRRLNQPWGMVFLPNGDMLITEKRGRLRLIHEGRLQPASIAGVPSVVT